MSRFLYFSRAALLCAFILTACATLLRYTGRYNPLQNLNHSAPLNERIEDFDPALSRLNSMDKIEEYCDSLYNAGGKATGAGFQRDYSDLVCTVIRQRFYHGYSHYGFGNNYIARAIAKMTNPGFSAIVVPGDILKYPFAACSQQSIVMMEILKVKGFKTRRVSFMGKKAGGHFCFEVFFDNGWHFYDPNMEPDSKVLNAYSRPSIAFLSHNTDILVKAYHQYPKEEILDIFPNYSYGAVNEFPAPRAVVFQRVTKFLSLVIWAVFLVAFLFVHRRYRRLSHKKYVRNRRIYFPQLQPGSSSTYYPGITAPRA